MTDNLDQNESPEAMMSDSERQAIVLGQPVVRLKPDDPIIAVVSDNNNPARADAIYQLVQKAYAEKQDHTWVGQRGSIVHREELTILEVLRCCSIAAHHMLKFQTDESAGEHLPVYTVDHVMDMPSMGNVEVNAHEMSVLVCYLLESLLKGKKEAKGFEQGFQAMFTSEVEPDTTQEEEEPFLMGQYTDSCHVGSTGNYAVFMPDDIVFSVGETVGLKESKGTVVIEGFTLDKDNDDVVVKTSRGDFTIKALRKICTEETQLVEEHAAKIDLTYTCVYVHPSKLWAVNSEGVVFMVGESVGHQGEKDVAVIEAFEYDEINIDVIVTTSRGTCTINFLLKMNPPVSLLHQHIMSGKSGADMQQTADDAANAFFQPMSQSEAKSTDHPSVKLHAVMYHREPTQKADDDTHVASKKEAQQKLDDAFDTYHRSQQMAENVIAAKYIILNDCQFDMLKFFKVAKNICVSDVGTGEMSDATDTIIVGGFSCRDVLIALANGIFLADGTNWPTDFILYKPQCESTTDSLKKVIHASGSLYYELMGTPDGDYIVIYEPGLALLVDDFEYNAKAVDSDNIDIPEITFNKTFDRKLVKEIVLSAPLSLGQPVEAPDMGGDTATTDMAVSSAISNLVWGEDEETAKQVEVAKDTSVPGIGYANNDLYKSLNAARRAIMYDCGHQQNVFLLNSKPVIVRDGQDFLDGLVQDSRSNIIDGGYMSQGFFLDAIRGLDDEQADFVLYRPQDPNTCVNLATILRTAGKRYFDILDTPDGKQIVIYRFGYEALVDDFVHGGYGCDVDDIRTVSFNVGFKRNIIEGLKLEKLEKPTTGQTTLQVLRDLLWQDYRSAMADLSFRITSAALASPTTDPEVSLTAELKLPDTCPVKATDMSIDVAVLGNIPTDFILYMPMHPELIERIYETTTPEQRQYADIAEIGGQMFVILYKPMFQFLVNTIRLNTSASLGFVQINKVQFNDAFYEAHVKSLGIVDSEPSSTPTTQVTPDGEAISSLCVEQRNPTTELASPVKMKLTPLVEKDEPSGPQCSGCPENTSGDCSES